MLKFDEEKQIASVQGALALRPRIEAIVDEICEKGFRNLCWLGIGGTWASCLQAEVHMKERSDLDLFVENAAEYLTTGSRRVGDGTIVVISSVTGSTEEMVRGVEKAKAAGARVLGFIDVETAQLAGMVDWEIAYPANEQLKFFMVADRFMYNRGEFPEYDEYYAQLDAHLARDLVEVEKAADAFGLEFAQKHHDDRLHYFVGAGNQYGSTYSYAMCYWEEQHWIRTKSIHAAEFFHGMLEIVDRDTPVTVFVGEDAQRSLGERVVKFLPRVCANYTVIDSRDYALPGIDDKYRGNLSHLVTHAVTQRIDAHMEAINCWVCLPAAISAIPWSGPFPMPGGWGMTISSFGEAAPTPSPRISGWAVWQKSGLWWKNTRCLYTSTRRNTTPTPTTIWPEDAPSGRTAWNIWSCVWRWGRP